MHIHADDTRVQRHASAVLIALADQVQLVTNHLLSLSAANDSLQENEDQGAGNDDGEENERTEEENTLTCDMSKVIQVFEQAAQGCESAGMSAIMISYAL